MKSITSTAAQSRFGALLDDAQSEPVAIVKNGKRSAVVLSAREYERLQDLEDRFWAAKADAAANTGFLSVEDSAETIRKLMKDA